MVLGRRYEAVARPVHSLEALAGSTCGTCLGDSVTASAGSPSSAVHSPSRVSALPS